MTKRTRYFLAGSAAVLVAGLCTGLVAYFGGGFQSLSAAPVASELRYVPADATVVAYADVQTIMRSELRQRLKAAMPMHQHGQEEFQKQTGIDIENDIDYIVAAVAGASPETGGFVVARGRFNDSQLEALAVQHGGVVETYQGKRVVSSPVNQHHGQFTLAFLEPGLLAMGAKAAVQQAIDSQRTSESVTKNSEMMDLVGEIALGNNAWAVGRFDMIASKAKLPAEVQQRMPPIKWFAAAGDINGGIRGMVRADATDEKSAELLRRQVNGLLALGEMLGGTDPKAAAMVKSLQMSGTGNTVAISFSLPAELLQMIPQAAGKQDLEKQQQ
jgi:hypothetical protein